MQALLTPGGREDKIAIHHAMIDLRVRPFSCRVSSIFLRASFLFSFLVSVAFQIFV